MKNIVYVGEGGDWANFIGVLEKLPLWQRSSHVWHRVAIMEGEIMEGELVRRRWGPDDLVILDWQIDVRRNIPPARLYNLITNLARRGARVVVVMDADDYRWSNLLMDLTEAGAVSFLERTVDAKTVEEWIERTLKSPWRGYWSPE